MILCYNVCKNKFIVDNSLKIYEISSKILGKNLTNYIVKNSFGQVFTGGENIDSMNKIY